MNALFIARGRLMVSLTDLLDLGIKGLRIRITLMIEPVEGAVRFEIGSF
jgi:hypothetical protein